MLDFFRKLFDSSDFIARRDCGGFGKVPGVLPLHLVSDVLIWLAYLAIPAVLVFFAWRRRELPFRGLFLMFGAFIVSCGITHFMEALLIFDPLYRLSGVIKLVTAVISWITVLALIPVVPRALALRDPQDLEREIAERASIEEALQRSRAELERRVQERTAELEKANGALKEEVAWRRKAEEEREQLLARERLARTEAENANRMKDEFLAMVSHELRTPLNAMLGWAHLLRGGKLDQAMTERGLEVLERNTLLQAQMIDDLLDVSRIITGKLRIESKPVDLVAVVRGAIDTVTPAAEAKGIELRVVNAGPPFLTQGDPTRLQQVAWNLLSNAVKFTPRGGRVETRLRRDGPEIELEVIDTGIGIPETLLPHVFERFRQGDSSITRQHGGLGLGLSIVRHLVELHGGTVSVESEGEGKGATFRVRLSVLAVAPGSKPDLPAVGLGSVSGMRVLVVDDEADAREMIAYVLRDAGAEVLTCGSAEEALAELTPYDPDVLVCDIGMPVMDGYELIRRVRDRGSMVPAVALTAFARQEDRRRALMGGFQMHASKPINPKELVGVVGALGGWRG
jgi:signal transduction histidine kinase